MPSRGGVERAEDAFVMGLAGGKAGRGRLGGEAVETCGLKVTLRVGLLGGIGRASLGVEEVGRRGEASEETIGGSG